MFKRLMKFLFQKEDIIEEELPLTMVVSMVGLMRQTGLDDEYSIFFFIFSISLSIFSFIFISSLLTYRGVKGHKKI